MLTDQCRGLLKSQLECLRRTPRVRGKWEIWLTVALMLGMVASAVYAEGAWWRFSGLLCALLLGIGLTTKVCIVESARSTQRLIEALLSDDHPPAGTAADRAPWKPESPAR